MKDLVEVFYLGRKAVKKDNVNKSPGAKTRRWSGFGASLKVPADEAEVLLSHDDVWGNESAVSGLAKVRKVEEKEAADRRDVEDAREERVAKEQAKLRTTTSPKSAAQDDGESEDRDALIRGAILSLDPKSDKDYTGQKKPRINRIQEIIGTTVSSEEVTVAFQDLVRDGKVKVPA